MNLGIVVILITATGYISNLLNWRYLNYKIIHLLYYIGALVHETSHAILCVLTMAKIKEFVIFSSQPHVTHQKSKIPIIGEVLISFAPIAGGLLFLFLINHYVLGNYFVIPSFDNFRNLLTGGEKILSQINIFEWKSWIMILLFFNVGAMIGPSTQDLKNVWPILIFFFFIKSPFLIQFGLMAICLILINIVLQTISILLSKILTIKVCK
jgi:hypothetical protein